MKAIKAMKRSLKKVAGFAGGYHRRMGHFWNALDECHMSCSELYSIMTRCSSNRDCSSLFIRFGLTTR